MNTNSEEQPPGGADRPTGFRIGVTKIGEPFEPSPISAEQRARAAKLQVEAAERDTAQRAAEREAEQAAERAEQADAERRRKRLDFEHAAELRAQGKGADRA